jgi:arginyl-tRNA synthetase
MDVDKPTASLPQYGDSELPEEFRKTLNQISFQLEDWFKCGQVVSQTSIEQAISEFEDLPSPKDDRIKMRLEKLQLIFGKSTDKIFDFSTIN